MARPFVRNPPRAPDHRHRRWILSSAVVLGALAAAVFVGVLITNRMETGKWEVPDTDDLVRIVRTVEGATPAKTIFLERHRLVLSPGIDDSSRGISSVLANARNKPTQLPGFSGGDARWSRIMTCVKDLFEPFDVNVTDKRPTDGDFVLVAVGGRPGDIGIKSRRISGLAPFDGDVIASPVVFAFSQQVDNDVRAICEAIGMEVAHTYGLDHGYDCKDVMTYLAPCGPKRFVDRDVSCGETKKRTCAGGAPTQNSYRRLLHLLGARAK